MPPKKTKQKDFWDHLSDVAKAFGVDGTLFLAVTVGAFAALYKKADANAVLGIVFILIGGWLAINWSRAYFDLRKSQLELDKTKQLEGLSLIRKHADRQGSLPLDPK